MLERAINRAWYGGFPWTWVLLPLMALYAYVVGKKRSQRNLATVATPVIVVGNITVGGTGKTPLTEALVNLLADKGLRVGIISRGYGASQREFPHLIVPTDVAKSVGDEPYMMYRTLGVPIVIDPDRPRALDRVRQEGVDLVLSDDGMQHYQLARDLEICVLDGKRGLGNGQLLPVGPLRESKERLNTVDYVLTYGAKGNLGFSIEPICWVNVKTGEEVLPDDFKLMPNHCAIAGIGRPEKFFETLATMNMKVNSTRAFPDHYDYEPNDLIGLADQILMTEKDAVKVEGFASKNMWFLRISAKLSEPFKRDFISKVQCLLENKNG